VLEVAEEEDSEEVEAEAEVREAADQDMNHTNYSLQPDTMFERYTALPEFEMNVTIKQLLFLSLVVFLEKCLKFQCMEK